MEPTEKDIAFKQLQKENRILKKKLERSEADRAKLEQTKNSKESLLKQVIVELQESQGILEQKSAALEQAIETLTLAQSKLVESEKMAALGTLVAGVAHEINTPVGTGVTLASTLADETEILVAEVARGGLTRAQFNDYLDTAQEVTALLLSNLNRASELVHSFKQVAVDQTHLEQRHFNLKNYCEEVLISLSPTLKRTSHTLTITGDADLYIESYPGAFAQVITNLVTNSLMHAYPLGKQAGHLTLDISQQRESVLLSFKDDGCGIPANNMEKIFEPFFTTARNRGGTGLGLQIVYNIVTQTLKGKVDVTSEVNQGTCFEISLPTNTGAIPKND